MGKSQRLQCVANTLHSVTVISVVRLQALTTWADSSNPTWNNLSVSQWSTIEINVGIICASMPTLRLLLLRVFPRLSGNSQAYGGYNAGRSWGDKKSAVARSKSAGYLDVSDASSGSAGRTARPGITYQRSYTVHYHDEIPSTVQLTDLDARGFEPKNHISECTA